MKSLVVKRSIIIDGHRTSVSIEEPFWIDLKKIARTQQVTLSELVTKIDHTREQGNLSSAIRLFVLHHFLLWGDKTNGWSESSSFRGGVKEHQQDSLPMVPSGTRLEFGMARSPVT